MLRRAIFLIHLYLGLTLGLLAAIMGLSGSLLVFSHQADESLNPQLLHARVQQKVAPVQPLLKQLKQDYPDARLQFIRVPQTPGGVYEIWMDKGQFLAYADPYSGKLLGARPARSSLPGFLFDLHTRLLAGERGHTAAGITGLALFTLGVTGIYLWWPRRTHTRAQDPGRWQRAISIKWGAHRIRVALDIHRLLGIVCVSLLCLISATGASLVFDDAAASLISAVTGDKGKAAKPKSKIVSGAATISIDDAIHTTQAAFPAATITRITPALKKTAPITFRLRFPGDIHPNGTSNVYIDRYSGKILQSDITAQSGTAARVVAMRYPLHTGNWLGLFSRLLQVFIGLVPAILYGTGLYVWWAKARARKRKPAAV
jgi:uncharacterized iron-regulated membrane protein